MPTAFVPELRTRNAPRRNSALPATRTLPTSSLIQGLGNSPDSGNAPVPNENSSGSSDCDRKVSAARLVMLTSTRSTLPTSTTTTAFDSNRT